MKIMQDLINANLNQAVIGYIDKILLDFAENDKLHDAEIVKVN